jgi:hypothetical protein
MKSIIRQFVLIVAKFLPASVGMRIMWWLENSRIPVDRWGVHIRKIGYYDPLPDFRTITVAQTLERRTPAILVDLPEQLELQRRISLPVASELEAIATEGYPFDNSWFSFLDASVYYALLRYLKPARVIEIGCGFSTRIADHAMKRNRAEGASGTLVGVEPYPDPRLTDFDLDMELIQRPVQDVPLQLFQELQGRDILFIDSSHVAKFRSDVCRLYLDVLPRLNAGVWIHVHDIFFPTDYPPNWLIERRLAFNEQYVLEAFLACNSAFRTRSALRWLWLDCRDQMRKYWPTPCLPPDQALGATSFWMERV